MIVVGSCYFLLTLLIPYDPNIDFVFPLIIIIIIVIIINNIIKKHVYICLKIDIGSGYIVYIMFSLFAVVLQTVAGALTVLWPVAQMWYI